MSCTKIGEFCKRPAERIPVKIPLRGTAFVRTWEGGIVHASTERVRARKVNGYEYECTSAGQTGPREPEWPTVIGGTVTDGSVTWTCRAVSNASLTRIIQSCTWLGGGLTVDGDTIVNTAGEAEVSAYVSGGVAGTVYEVIARITFGDGSIEEGLVEVTVD